MSYLVIARKWRPVAFDEVIGQRHVTQTLKNAISFNRIAHAYIFSGPRGVGKTTVARIFARALNCKDGPTPNPCNNCPSCIEVSSGSSVDVLEIDGASNTGVDNVRDIRDSIRYMPTRGKYRVYIIDEVHMLSIAAFNALLKTLEEPPPHAIFIFATTEAHKVPATILSRCQRFDFKRIPIKDVQAHLMVIAKSEGITIDDGELYLISKEADGSMRDAQSLLDQVISFAGKDIKGEDVIAALGLMDRSILYDLTTAMIGKDGKRCLNIVENIYNFGYDLRKLSVDILEHIRNLIVVKVVGVDAGVIDLPDNELEALKDIAGQVNTFRLHMLFNLMTKCYEDISRSAFPRFLIEMTFLKASHIEDVEPIANIIEGLDELGRDLYSSDSMSERGELTPVPTVDTGKGNEFDEKNSTPEKTDPVPARTIDVTNGKDLVRFIMGRSRHLASCIDSVAISKVDQGTEIKVKASVYNYVLDHKDRLRTLCKEYFDKAVRVNIEIDNKKEPSKKEEGVYDPIVKKAVQLFNGKVIERHRRINV